MTQWHYPIGLWRSSTAAAVSDAVISVIDLDGIAPPRQQRYATASKTAAWRKHRTVALNRDREQADCQHRKPDFAMKAQEEF